MYNCTANSALTIPSKQTTGIVKPDVSDARLAKLRDMARAALDEERAVRNRG